MPIQCLEVENLERPWKLKPATFESFNLLVGLSGGGKSRTLSVIHELGKAARGEMHNLVNYAWSVSVETPKGVIRWQARTEPDGALTSSQGRRRILSS